MLETREPSSFRRPLVTETVAAPASEETSSSSPVVVEDGESCLASMAVMASSAAVVSSDETSGKEDTAEGLEDAVPLSRASNGLVYYVFDSVSSQVFFLPFRAMVDGCQDSWVA